MKNMMLQLKALFNETSHIYERKNTFLMKD